LHRRSHPAQHGISTAVALGPGLCLASTLPSSTKPTLLWIPWRCACSRAPTCVRPRRSLPRIPLATYRLQSKARFVRDARATSATCRHSASRTLTVRICERCQQLPWGGSVKVRRHGL